MLDLHVCPECDRELVYPVEWEEASPRTGRCSCAAPTASGPTWASSTRTPSTASTRSSTSGTEALVRDLKRLTQANMEDETERFVAALGADAILPEDF